MIDLHAHSTASDGTTPPDALVREAAAAGLSVLALTDHDTTAGWSAAAEALPAGLSLVRGAEISCNHRGVSLHLLAYLFDDSDPALTERLAQVRSSRLTRAQRMVELLAADACGDLAYTVGIERYAASTTSGSTVHTELRVTHVYRREPSGWKIVHRHGDHIPEDRAG